MRKHKKLIIALLLLLIVVIVSYFILRCLLWKEEIISPTPTPSPRPPSSAMPVVTPVPAVSYTPEPATPGVMITLTASYTPEPTQTPAAAPRPRPTITPALIPPPTETPSPELPHIITPSPEPTPAPALTPESRPPLAEAGAFELPINGATGFTTVEMNLRSRADGKSETLRRIHAGTAFRVIEEKGAYWRVDNGDWAGWLEHKYCMVNLPDVIPSIVYENTNASSSLMRSSGKALPGITGKQLYNSQAYNERFGKTMYIMPVLYSMAKKIHTAQQAALNKGDSLKIYEAYRPHSAQRAIVSALSKLADNDAQVKRGLSKSPWSVSWFIAQSRSNHQLGCAIDVSLVKVLKFDYAYTGDFPYSTVANYEEYLMPSTIHELSVASVAFESPVSPNSATAWKSAALSKSMNAPAISLQSYCTAAKLTPLASEWWHFNDLAAKDSIGKNTGQGQTVLTQLCSSVP